MNLNQFVSRRADSADAERLAAVGVAIEILWTFGSNRIRRGSDRVQLGSARFDLGADRSTSGMVSFFL